MKTRRYLGRAIFESKESFRFDVNDNESFSALSFGVEDKRPMLLEVEYAVCNTKRLQIVAGETWPESGLPEGDYPYRGPMFDRTLVSEDELTMATSFVGSTRFYAFTPDWSLIFSYKWYDNRAQALDKPLQVIIDLYEVL